MFSVQPLALREYQNQSDENGLPTTPPYVQLIGRYDVFCETLKSIPCVKRSFRLAQYVDVIRYTNDVMVLVAESPPSEEEAVAFNKWNAIDVSYQLLDAISLLHSVSITIGNLSIESVSVSKLNGLKLHNYALYELTKGNEMNSLLIDPTAFPIPCAQTMSPEQCVAELVNRVKLDTTGLTRLHPEVAGRCAEVATDLPCGTATDVWAYGCILLRLFTGVNLWPDSLSPTQLIGHLLRLSKMTELSALDYPQCSKAEELCSSSLIVGLSDVVTRCLYVDPKRRPTVEEIKTFKLFASTSLTVLPNHFHPQLMNPFDGGLYRSKFLELNQIDSSLSDFSNFSPERAAELDILELLNNDISQFYNVWKLSCGEDVASQALKGVMVEQPPPIATLPRSVLRISGVTSDKDLVPDLSRCRSFSAQQDGGEVVQRRDWIRLKTPAVLVRIHNEADSQESWRYPLLLGYTNADDERSTTSDSDAASADEMVDPLPEMSSLPILIKERDVEYQLRRIILFNRLLQGYPFTRKRIWAESQLDIPPAMRGHVWAALLNVRLSCDSIGDVSDSSRLLGCGANDAISPYISNTVQRQIDVDVPRCHQYECRLASSVGHCKLRRLLTRWLVNHSNTMPHRHATAPAIQQSPLGFDYWQGLDSLAAPFLYVNFYDDDLAYQCLSRFIEKYQHNFFLKDNSHVITEYLCVFNQLLAFHEPALYSHLSLIGFKPDLYAIPWFLTMFAHVLPIGKIMHLWDTLLLGNCNFPLCVGIALMMQLKPGLLQNQFNECILLFSDMPEIDIDKAVKDARRIFCQTPRSATNRVHSIATITDKGSTLSDDQVKRFEASPRITASDAIDLLSASALNTIVVDVRESADFQRTNVAGSISAPGNDEGNSSNTQDLSPLAIDRLVTGLSQKTAAVKIVMGYKNEPSVSQVAEWLVNAGYRSVCIADGGMELLRPLLLPAGLLTTLSG